MLGLKIVCLFCFQLLVFISAEKLPISLDDVVSNTYHSSPFNGTWISETELFYTTGKEIYIFDVTTRENKLFATLNNIDDSSHVKSISPDRKYVLIRKSKKSVYRHSSLSKFYIYNLKKNSVRNLQDEKSLSTAFWVPNSNSLIYVLKNDIYYYEIKYNKTRKLTDDGELQYIYNGVPDWIYEEEVLTTDSAMWISPTGDHLAFATFNDSAVHEAVILRYGDPDKIENQYPKEEKFRYPKAGTTNPHVTLNLIDLSDHGSSIVHLHTPIDIVGPEAILYAVKWFDAKTLVATWTNRVQNQSQIVSYTLTGKYTYLLCQSQSNGWLLYPNVPPLYYHNNVFILSPRSVGNKSDDSFSHLIRYRLLNDVLTNETDLTPDKTWVTDILGVSDVKRVVYFMASPANEPSQRHLYEASLDFENSLTSYKCISCEIKTPEGNKCRFVGHVHFSKDYSNYVLTCSGPDLSFTNIYDYEHKEIYKWSDNNELRQKLKHRILPKFEDLTVNSHGHVVNIRLYLPSGLDKSKKYPLILNVYAGPDTQRITDHFGVGFESYMSTNKHIAYAFIDGRGSSNKGTAIMYEVYRNLGINEIEDQILGVEKLTKKHSWIDKKRVGVWGWSYGGYATAMILTGDFNNIFKCGISVAPVVNWIYYDSIYTERYMGLPSESDNLKMYKANSVLHRAEMMKNKKYMLIHGTGDDNVHFQQSIMFSKVLAEKDVIFEQFSYADENHSLNDVLKHLYHNMDLFWSRCFNDEKKASH